MFCHCPLCQMPKEGKLKDHTQEDVEHDEVEGRCSCTHLCCENVNCGRGMSIFMKFYQSVTCDLYQVIHVTVFPVTLFV